MASKATLENAMRNEIIEVIVQAMATHFHIDPSEIEKVSSSELTFLLNDKEGNEKFPKIKVSIPRGTRNGEGGYIPYNGHEAAEDYRFEQEMKAQEKAEKKAAKEAEKRKKEEEKDE